MENKMILQIKYSCGTCGLEHVVLQALEDKCLAEQKLWHICQDGYDVPLQVSVSKIHRPVLVPVTPVVMGEQPISKAPIKNKRIK